MNSYEQGYLDAVIGVRLVLETKKSVSALLPEDGKLRIEIQALEEVVKFLKIKMESNEES